MLLFKAPVRPTFSLTLNKLLDRYWFGSIQVGDYDPKQDHRAGMDEVMRKIKAQYQFRNEDIL